MVLAPNHGDCELLTTSDRRDTSHFECSWLSSDYQSLFGICINRRSFRVPSDQIYQNVVCAYENPTAQVAAKRCNVYVSLDEARQEVKIRLNRSGLHQASEIRSILNRKLIPGLVREGANRRSRLKLSTTSQHSSAVRNSNTAPMMLPPSFWALEQNYQ